MTLGGWAKQPGIGHHQYPSVGQQINKSSLPSDHSLDSGAAQAYQLIYHHGGA
jgi:hypothetical protein